MYLIYGDWKRAINFEKKSLYLARKAGYVANDICALNGLAQIYMDAGQLYNAEKYLKKALYLAQVYKLNSNLVKIYPQLVRLYILTTD